MTALRQRMLEDMQVRNLSPHTQRSYVQQVSLFARHYQQSPECLGPEEIRAYQLYLTHDKQLSVSSILIAVAARRCAFSTRSRSGGTGRSRTSFRPRRSRSGCPLCSAPRKSSSFSAA